MSKRYPHVCRKRIRYTIKTSFTNHKMPSIFAMQFVRFIIQLMRRRWQSRRLLGREVPAGRAELLELLHHLLPARGHGVRRHDPVICGRTQNIPRRTVKKKMRFSKQPFPQICRTLLRKFNTIGQLVSNRLAQNGPAHLSEALVVMVSPENVQRVSNDRLRIG